MMEISNSTTTRKHRVFTFWKILDKDVFEFIPFIVENTINNPIAHAIHSDIKVPAATPLTPISKLITNITSKMAFKPFTTNANNNTMRVFWIAINHPVTPKFISAAGALKALIEIYRDAGSYTSSLRFNKGSTNGIMTSFSNKIKTPKHNPMIRERKTILINSS